MHLTGNVRVRAMIERDPLPYNEARIFLVLEVEETASPSTVEGPLSWRDATVEDLQRIGLKGTLR